VASAEPSFAISLLLGYSVGRLKSLLKMEILKQFQPVPT
jgi:hypothetical protein